MNKISALLIAFLFGLQMLQSQNNINSYAYVIIPEQFHFQKRADQYQLSSLSQFLFKRAGMKAFKNSEAIPNELNGIDCGGLRFKLIKESNAFRIKTSFELVNCKNQVVFKSNQGSTIHKDFKKGYQESVRNAFKSFEELGYKYEGKVAKAVMPIPVVVKKPILTTKTNSKSKGHGLVVSNESISIQLNESRGSYIGKVLTSRSINYTKGDLICKLFKTSLPNVFKAEWKDAYGNFINTIGYFNEVGNLHIDVVTPDGISVVVFEK